MFILTVRIVVLDIFIFKVSLSIFQSKSRSTKSGSSLCLRAAGVSSSEVDLAPEPAGIIDEISTGAGKGEVSTLPLLSLRGGG